MPAETTKNKILWGLAKAAYAKITTNPETGLDEYGSPVFLQGMRQLGAKPNGALTEVYADGSIIFVGQANNGYEVTIEVTALDNEFALWALGEHEDEKGMIYESNVVQPGRFALLWEWVHDQKNTRHVLYDCTANRPELKSITRGDGGKDTAQYQTLTIKAIPRKPDGYIKMRTKTNTDSVAYDSFFTTVPVPVLTP